MSNVVIYMSCRREARDLKKVKKTLKKVLTNSSECDIIIEFAEKRQEKSSKNEKTSKKFKKVLDKHTKV